MTDICQHLQMNKGHISSVMDSLCKKGYIVQTPDKNDRRYIRYTVAKSADSIVTQMDASWENMSHRLIAGISKEDLAIFEKVAKQIGTNIENMLEE